MAKFLGYELRKITGKKAGREAIDFDRTLQILLERAKRSEAPVILDVGAHRGESVARFRKSFPGSRIFCFEPNSDNFAVLKSKLGATPDVEVFNCALGATAGKRTLQQNIKSDTSSFLPLNPDSDWLKRRATRFEVDPEDFTSKENPVAVQALDQFCQEQSIDRIQILKIDTQGFEPEVLKGAETFLKNRSIDVLEVEIMLGDIYASNVNFLDLETHLIPNGYKFVGIDRPANLISTPDSNPNVIYARSELLEAKS